LQLSLSKRYIITEYYQPLFNYKLLDDKEKIMKIEI